LAGQQSIVFGNVGFLGEKRDKPLGRLGADGCLGQEPSNNGIEQTNGGRRMMMPFAAHPGRWTDE
jgi:hypothetical protein